MNITGPARSNCCKSQCQFLCCVSSALGRVLLHWSYGTCSGVRPCLDWRPRCTLTTRRVAGSRVLSDFYRYRFWLTPVASGIGQADGSVASRRHRGGVRVELLGRSILHLIYQLSDLQARGIEFRSLQENIDTSSPGGRLVFHIFASLAEFERDLIRERTHAGLAAARARGRTGGRPPLLTDDKLSTARKLYAQQDMTVAQIGEVLGVSRTTIYRALRRDSDGGLPARRGSTKTV